MTKRLVAKTGEYTNQQGETKGEYTKIGVLMSGNNGEFLLLDPSINLAGVLLKQNALAAAQGKPVRDSVMISVFEDSNQGQNQQQGYQQQPQQNYKQQQQQQYQNNQYNNNPPF